MHQFFKHIVIAFIMTWSIANICAQMYEFPDTNFRNIMQIRYPKMMFEGRLSIDSAKKFTGGLNLKNANLSDASGLELFNLATSLYLNNNNLTQLPNLENFINLQNFYSEYNQLKTLEGFDNMTKLIDFQVQYNQLIAIPSLSNSNNLLQLYANDNLIQSLPDLKKFPRLLILDIGNNPLVTNYDYGVLTELRELHVHNTGIDTIIGLPKLKKLKHLFAWGNQLTSLTGIDSLVNIELCSFENNQIKTLPYLLNKPNLNYLTISSNYLTFSDLELLKGREYSYYKYDPQKKTDYPSLVLREQSNYTFNSNFDNAIANNVYVWKKNGLAIDSSSSRKFTLNKIQKSDSGNYELSVYNSDFPLLILKSSTFRLYVDSCMTLHNFDFTIEKQNCSTGYSIDFEPIVIIGGQLPYTFTLSSENYRDKKSESYIENIPPGTIKILIKDAKFCELETSFKLNKVLDCESVFSPNGDGISDTYFFEQAGKIEIFSTNHTKINEFIGPFVWNGCTNQSDFVAAGLYAVLINNEELFYITVIK